MHQRMWKHLPQSSSGQLCALHKRRRLWPCHVTRHKLISKDCVPVSTTQSRIGISDTCIAGHFDMKCDQLTSFL